jgi:hypothetical protein
MRVQEAILAGLLTLNQTGVYPTGTVFGTGLVILSLFDVALN